PSATATIRTGPVSTAVARSGAAAVNTIRTGGVARAWAVTAGGTGGVKAPTVALMVAGGTRTAVGGIAPATKCAHGWGMMRLNAVAVWTRCGSEATTDVAPRALHARMSESAKMSVSV